MIKKLTKSLTNFLYIFIFITSYSLLITPTFSSNNDSDLNSKNRIKTLKDKDKIKK